MGYCVDCDGVSVLISNPTIIKEDACRLYRDSSKLSWSPSLVKVDLAEADLIVVD